MGACILTSVAACHAGERRAALLVATRVQDQAGFQGFPFRTPRLKCSSLLWPSRLTKHHSLTFPSLQLLQDIKPKSLLGDSKVFWRNLQRLEAASSCSPHINLLFVERLFRKPKGQAAPSVSRGKISYFAFPTDPATKNHFGDT